MATHLSFMHKNLASNYLVERIYGLLDLLGNRKMPGVFIILKISVQNQDLLTF